MKEIPMLFSAPMVQAIMEGRKTQTRRLVDAPDLIAAPDRFRFIGDSVGRDFPRPAIKYDDRVWYEWQLTNSNEASWVERCRWEKGDLLWVRETWRGIDQDYGQPRYEYKATETINVSEKWKPSIHMPKEAARIWLQVESVRAELLQDITEDDAISEGVEKMGEFVFPYKHYASGAASCIDAKTSFRTLWQAINGDESWVLNPWVWVISFKVLSTTGKPSTNVI